MGSCCFCCHGSFFLIFLVMNMGCRSISLLLPDGSCRRRRSNYSASETGFWEVLRNFGVHSRTEKRERVSSTYIFKRVLEDQIQASFSQIKGLKCQNPIEASHMDPRINCLTSWGGRNTTLTVFNNLYI